MTETGKRPPVLEVAGLAVKFAGQGGRVVEAVRGLDLVLPPGRTLGLVGESGSGKTISCLAILGLLPRNATMSGQILLEGARVSGLDEEAYSRVRGSTTSIVFQEPRKHLDPSMRLGAQLEEVLTHNLGLSRGAARARAGELLASVGLDPVRVSASYPHELSGGMCQRASIAMAVSCDPALLIADEPTTALDASAQRSILDVLSSTVADGRRSMVFVTHDLRAVNYVADEVAVMLHGLVVERGPCKDLIATPRHPYTRLLMDSIPGRDFLGKRRALSSPSLGPGAEGCPFSGRCAIEGSLCSRSMPGLEALPDGPGGRLLRCFKGGLS